MPVAPRKKKPTTRQQVINGQYVGQWQWKQLRARWQKRLPIPCPRCGIDIQPWDAWDLDHVGVPVSLGATDGDIRPAHQACNRKAGGQLGQDLTRLGKAAALGMSMGGGGVSSLGPHGESGLLLPEVGSVFVGGRVSLGDSPGTPPTQSDPAGPFAPGPAGLEPDGPEPFQADPDDAEPSVTTPDPLDAVWDSCPWLDPLRKVPPDATWPRLMSAPHPDAVGSYGPEAEELAARLGVQLRWWQRLAVFRLLEHDRDGLLVWVDALISTARQVGKSVLLVVLAWWRLHQTERFGQPQLVMHTGKDISVSAEVQRRARITARELGYKTREANGQQEIHAPDGSRWMVRAHQSVYGYPATLALADEAWKLAAAVVEEGLEPTLAETFNGQLVMFSTAHRSCTALVPVRRAALLDRWAIPGGPSLLMEWSGDRRADIGDRDAWREASPHWGPQRERLMEAKYARASGGQSVDPDEDDPVESFRSQFLNVWPVRRIVASTKAELLVDRDTWAHAADIFAPVPDGPLVVAVEDFYGLGAAAAAAVALPDGRTLVWGDVFGTRGEAYAWASFTRGRREGCRVLAGASFPATELADALGPDVERRASADTYAALPLIRSMVRGGRLVHSGDEPMAAQFGTVRVVPTSSGGLTPAHKGIRADLLKATAWAVQATVERAAQPLEFFVY